ncbi:MAG: hypothetical protein IIC85_13780, partial [Chloroflexi bacterium]|nr:hypothetical protein [Chloroflexota bacterium]
MEPAPGQLIRCTAIYGYHDSSINLGSDFVGGETYSVVVNDTVTETFVAQGGGTVGEDNGLQDYELAPIVEVKLFAGQTAGEAALVVISSLPTSCQTFGNYTLLEEEEVIVLDIYNALPFGRDVVCSKRNSEVTTRVELSGNYEKYRVYTARVNGKPYGLQACANRKCVHPDPVFAEVPIERLALQLAESTNQPELMITSGLQYSCYHLVINRINRGGETIYVSLYNTVPLFSGLECAEDYRTIETTVDIPGSMEPCKVYRIVMNGDEFLNHFVQAIAPDVTCAKLEPVGYPLPDEPEYPTADVPAPIESVQITKTESLPPEYLVDIT